MNPLANVPPWVQYFLIHVIKRCLGICLAAIEDMQAANKEPVAERNNSLK